MVIPIAISHVTNSLRNCIDLFNPSASLDVAISYRMSLVICASKMRHAVQTRIFGISTLTTMSVELLLCQDIAAALRKDGVH